MRIALMTQGTRGDVQPFVALALALMARGHEVVLGVSSNLVSFVERCGVRADRFCIDSQAFLESDRGQAWLSSGNVSSFMKELGAITRAHRDELMDDYERICAGADVLVTALLTEDYASAIAEARRLPLLSVHFNPMRANEAYPNALVTHLVLPGFLNRATGALADKAWWGAHREDVNAFRARLGLPATAQSTARRFAAHGTQTLHAFSPTIAPRPEAYGDTQPVLGAIRFPPSAREKLGETAHDPQLAAWLAEGSAPVYFGLGSMPVKAPAEMLRMVAAAAEEHGVRAVIGAGWSRLEAARELGDHVRIVEAVDHGWLLPRCSAAVHHGGAGTTFAALGADLPALVTSVFGDQPFWGARIERLGAGVHLPFRKLGPARLQRALGQVLDPSVQATAKRLGALLRAEPDATPAIVKRIEALASA